MKTPASELADQSGGLCILMVDAACYSLPYDYSLCDVLSRIGNDVTLVRSEFLHTEWESTPRFRDHLHFYRLASRLSRAHFPPPLVLCTKGLEHVTGMARLVRWVQLSRPSIIHFQWMAVPIVDVVVLRALRRHAPVFITAHNTSLSRGQYRTRVQAIGYEQALRHVDGLIVHTQFSRNELLRWANIDPGRIHVIPHGTLEYYRAYSSDIPNLAPRDETTFLFFGNIAPHKGVDLLLDAFSRVPRRLREKGRLVVAGRAHPAEAAALHRLAVERGIADRVTWIDGFVAEKDVADLFRRCDVVVLPYRSIDQSGVLMTALAFDKAVIATRVGGFPETIQHGVHGYLVPPGDPASLADALATTLANPREREEMAAAVEQLRSTQLTWTRVARLTLDAYASSLAFHRSRE